MIILRLFHRSSLTGCEAVETHSEFHECQMHHFRIEVHTISVAHWIYSSHFHTREFGQIYQFVSQAIRHQSDI